ncbi:hypothetical protein NZK35_27150 [Stieleria sp. ICT_E10.1]|uniref:hypothetical protein n=1 Tax=Stieleria sedimenti TaxID=2976331 RepID=UPI00217FCEF0|nr:hypothetical protein [Stieleria sedimenti]MCS7470343.1 hypothetical protein [Stieleria sedimenti]
MKTRSLALPCALVAAMMLASLTDVAAQDSATDPPLPGNPLTRMMSGLNPMNWQMPKLKMPTMSTFLPSKDEKERVITKKDSLVDEVSMTAKKSWQRTKDTLNPMRLIPAGFRQDSQAAPAPAAKQQGGFFSNLFSPFPKSEDDEVNRSVNEFLKQEPIR